MNSCSCNSSHFSVSLRKALQCLYFGSLIKVQSMSLCFYINIDYNSKVLKPGIEKNLSFYFVLFLLSYIYLSFCPLEWDQYRYTIFIRIREHHILHKMDLNIVRRSLHVDRVLWFSWRSFCSCSERERLVCMQNYRKCREQKGKANKTVEFTWNTGQEQACFCVKSKNMMSL